MILAGTEMGEGAPLVLLHGLFGAGSNFGTVQRRLAAQHRVLTLDLRNHGRSPHGMGMAYATMAADVLDSLDERGIGAAGVLGHSMGGKVAMAMALLQPDRVSRLLVADIAPAAYAPHHRALIGAMQAVPLTPGLTRAEADAALTPAVRDAGVRGFLLQNLLVGAAPTWRLGLHEIAAGLPEIEGWAGTGVYPGPVLSLQGERSDYVLPEHRPAFRALFPAVRFATLHGAGHWLHAEAPEAFLAATQAFFSPAA